MDQWDNVGCRVVSLTVCNGFRKLVLQHQHFVVSAISRYLGMNLIAPTGKQLQVGGVGPSAKCSAVVVVLAALLPANTQYTCTSSCWYAYARDSTCVVL